MSFIENGSRYTAIRRALKERSDVTVVDEIVAEARVDGRTGKTYTDTRMLVAPTDGSLSTEELNKLSSELLPRVEPVSRHGANIQVGENGEVLSYGRLRSFDRLGDRNYRTIAVEIYPSQEEALQKRG